MIKVYGASDDLIEVDGDIRDEFYASDEQSNLLSFSNGVVLEVEYNKSGQWKISVLKNTWEMALDYKPATNTDDNYSDVLEMDTNPYIEGWVYQVDPWVVLGHEWSRRK